jgi:hypothetical protein
MFDAHQLEQAKKASEQKTGKRSFVAYASDSTGPPLLAGDALLKLCNAIDRVNEVGKMAELVQNLEGGTQSLLKVMQWIDNWVNLPENAKLKLDGLGAGAGAIAAKKKKKKGKAGQEDGEDGDDDEEEEPGEDGERPGSDVDDDSLGRQLQNAKNSTEATYAALAIMTGGAGGIMERRVGTFVFAASRCRLFY